MHSSILAALEELECTPETFPGNSSWLDEVCEEQDKMGMLQGWAFRVDGGEGTPNGIPAVDVIFEHGMISAYLPTFTVFAERNLFKLEPPLLESLFTSVPADHPVQPLEENEEAGIRATCGHCNLSWDDSIVTELTPVPSGRCPFENFHVH